MIRENTNGNGGGSDSEASPARAGGSLELMLPCPPHGAHLLLIRYALLDPGAVPVDRARMRAGCAGGCRHYGLNWACPPYATEFGALARDRGPLLTAWLRLRPIDERWRPGLADDAARNFFETAVGGAATAFCLDVARNLGGLFLGWGECTACGKDGCSALEGLPCRDHRRRRYSLEATGVVVSDLVRAAFGDSLSWSTPEERKLPPRECTRVVGALAPRPLGPRAAAAMMEAAAAGLAG